MLSVECAACNLSFLEILMCNTPFVMKVFKLDETADSVWSN